MTSTRAAGVGSLWVATGLVLAGCAAAGGTVTEAGDPPAVVEAAPDGGPSHLRLTEEAAQRLGVETAPVEGDPAALTIPHAAVVYDAGGASWAFVEIEPRVYQRAPITITAIEGDIVQLAAGPAPGAQVVTVAAAELVGVEAGISGGE
jgi:hypothetical protein